MDRTPPRKEAAAAPFDVPAAIDRALGYPYDVLKGSFLFEDGEFRPLPEEWDEVLRDRRPVPALGSNGSRTKLRALYADPAAGRAIPIVRATLRDFDVVYSAHLTRYGALPAALAQSGGTAVTVPVLYLTDFELERLHATEALGRNYDFARLRGIRLEAPGHDALSEVSLYATRHGLFRIDGAPVTLDGVAARGRRWGAMSERAALESILPLFAEVDGLERLIVESVRDPRPPRRPHGAAPPGRAHAGDRGAGGAGGIGA